MPIRVFLVEDLQQLRDIMVELLATLGEFPLASASGTEAEARLWVDEHPNDWDLAVIDLILAEGTGMGVIAHCKRNRPDAKVVVYSDYATPGIRAHCLKLGADAVFQKSTETPEFLAWCSALAAAS